MPIAPHSIQAAAPPRTARGQNKTQSRQDSASVGAVKKIIFGKRRISVLCCAKAHFPRVTSDAARKSVFCTAITAIQRTTQRTVRRSGQSSMPHRRDYIPAECVRLRGDSASSVRPRYCTAPSAERAARIAALRSRRESRRQSAADGGYASKCSSSRSRRSSGSSVRRAAARTSRPTVRMTRGIMRAVSLPSVLR